PFYKAPAVPDSYGLARVAGRSPAFVFLVATPSKPCSIAHTACLTKKTSQPSAHSAPRKLSANIFHSIFMDGFFLFLIIWNCFFGTSHQDEFFCDVSYFSDFKYCSTISYTLSISLAVFS
ncbi:MAG: hypothetical protein EBR01_13900, partial [Proteobacteria bacterium]|nr:hypothetical protein [Pseudomonadota bacterium]